MRVLLLFQATILTLNVLIQIEGQARLITVSVLTLHDNMIPYHQLALAATVFWLGGVSHRLFHYFMMIALVLTVVVANHSWLLRIGLSLLVLRYNSRSFKF